MRRFLISLPLLLALSGCQADDLRKAQDADTIEAYEEFLTKYPTAVQAPILKTRIKELKWASVEDGGTSAAARAYLKKYPDGARVKEATRLEDEWAFNEAVEAGTPDALQAYLDTHPQGKFRSKAGLEREELVYRHNMSVGEAEVTRINLAKDPEGPLNGWAVHADITNGGTRTLSEVRVIVEYLDGAGKVLGQDTWWAVATQLVGMPTPPWVKPPLPPTELRRFEWTTGEPPEGWAQKVNLKIDNLRFE